MKTKTSGIALLECLVYIAGLAVVLGIAYQAFYAVLEHTTRLNRTSNDITRALAAGELWRADIRRSSGLPKIDPSGGRLTLLQNGKEIIYAFTSNSVYRAEGTAQSLFLTQVKASRMLVDDATSCRWELELDPGRKPGKTKPLFTFQAAPGK
jgi:hypothetical protein